MSEDEALETPLESDAGPTTDEGGETSSPLDLPGAKRPPLDVREIALDEIAERDNVRPAYHGIESLAETIHLRGQLQPCVVRPAPDGATHGKPFELIFGHRRKRAAEHLRDAGIAGWEMIRCEVREVAEDEQIADMIVENFQRDQLSPVAEARAMMELKYTASPPLSNAEVGRRLGCDASHVSHRLSMLMKLAPPKMKRELEQQKAIGPAGSGESEQAEGAAEGAEEVEVIANPAADAAERDGSAEALEAGGDADGTDEPEDPDVDILELVDQGEISASTAEVIASLDGRKEQEKLAQLVVRHQWGVKKAAKWARDVQTHTLDEGSEAMGAIEMLEPVDVTELPHLNVRSDISDDEVSQVVLYALLRNGLDQEMLEYLDERMGYPYQALWSYVSSLAPDQVAELTRRLALRYISSAHRWFDLEPALKDQLGTPDAADDELNAILGNLKLALPKASEQ